jgi:uncharacterized protein
MNFKIIDCHTHAWPEKVASRARENLESLFKITFAAAPTLDSLAESMRRLHIEASVICAVATKPEQVPSINDWMFVVRGGQFRVFCAMHPRYPEWRKELLRIKAQGDGIKFQPEFQDFFVDDEQMFPMYEEIMRLGLPVLFHCGEELSGTMQVRSNPKRILAVHRRFPQLKIIAAHFGGFKHWEETREFLLGEDVYLDTSYFFNFLPAAQVKELLEHHKPDRLLFGSDFPLADPAADIAFLEKLDISRELKEMIFYDNAAALLKIV